MLAGCPKAEKSLRVARENSAKMASYGEKIVQANIDAFKAGEISRELLVELNGLTGAFVNGLGGYRQALAAAEAAVKAGDVDKTQLDYLYAIFDDQVVAAFFALLARFNVLKGPLGETVKTILASIRLTIRAIQGAFAASGYRGGIRYVSA
jgi:hypothetical protein